MVETRKGPQPVTPCKMQGIGKGISAPVGNPWASLLFVVGGWIGAALFVHAAMDMFLGGALPYVVPVVLALGAAHVAFLERSLLPHGQFLKRGIALLLAAFAVWLAVPGAEETAIQWQSYAPELLDAARKGGRPVMIDFRADWCAECRQMDRNVFSRRKVGRAAAGFMALQADMSHPDPQTQALAEKLDVHALPTVIFIGGEGAERSNLRLVGFERAEDFVIRLQRAK
jgi:thiol:disulfide interchange protein